MPFQILSLSGGGYLGLYTASVLALIEERTGRPVADSFDMIVGTSVGGIIGLGVSAGTRARDIKQAFLDYGHEVFPSSRPPASDLGAWLRALRRIPCARYSPKALRKIIDAVVGEGRKMSDLRRPTLIPAVNLTKGGPRVFKTGHHESFSVDWRLNVVEVALATSAAPTYFPIHQIGDEAFADGGLFANSPDLIGLHEAEHFLGKSRADIRMLSIGTTTTEFAFSSSTRPRLGAFGWIRNERLTTVMIGSQQAISNDMMQHNLGERYVRIDRKQSPDQKRELALDCASRIAKNDLQAMAANSVQEISSSVVYRDMLLHEAPPFRFINTPY